MRDSGILLVVKIVLVLELVLVLETVSNIVPQIWVFDYEDEDDVEDALINTAIFTLLNARITGSAAVGFNGTISLNSLIPQSLNP